MRAGQRFTACFCSSPYCSRPAGGTAGLVLGLTIVGGIALLAPELPVHPSPGYVVLAVLVAVLIGLAAGVAPARNAARLVPVEALRGE